MPNPCAERLPHESRDVHVFLYGFILTPELQEMYDIT